MSRTGVGDYQRRQNKNFRPHQPTEEGEHGELDSLDSSPEDGNENTSVVSSSSDIDIVGSPKKSRRRSPRIPAKQDLESPSAQRVLKLKLGAKKDDVQRCQDLTRPPIHGHKKRTLTQDKQLKSKESDSSYTCWIAFIVVVVASMSYVFLKESGSDSIPEVYNVSDTFKKEYQAFMSKFPGQSERFFRVLKAASRQIVEKEDPSQPAVFIIIFSKSSIHTKLCLTKHFLQTIKFCLSPHLPKPYESLDIPEISISSLGDLSDAKAVKEVLDEKLFTGLTEHKVVSVHDIHQLPGEAALMFHGYCDNDNAPFKKAVIVLTLEMREELLQEKMDEMVEKHLTDLWGRQLETDQLTAVLSRVANNIATIRPEKKETLDKYCET